MKYRCAEGAMRQLPNSYHHYHNIEHIPALPMPPTIPGLMQSLFSSRVWGGQASPNDFSGCCGAALPHHNNQKEEYARDCVPRAPNLASALPTILPKSD